MRTGLGSLNEARAGAKPLKSLNWSPKLAAIVKLPSSWDWGNCEAVKKPAASAGGRMRDASQVTGLIAKAGGDREVTLVLAFDTFRIIDRPDRRSCCRRYLTEPRPAVCPVELSSVQEPRPTISK